MPGQTSQRRPPLPVGTKDRECPPRCLISLKTGPEDTSPSHDPADGPGAVAHGTNRMVLALYPELPRRGGVSVPGPGTSFWEGQETAPSAHPALAEPGIENQLQSQTAVARW